MHTLDKGLRSALENTILAARSAAEEAAQIVLEALGVGEKVPFPHLNDAERTLRRKLRSHGRQLGDWLYEEGKQTIVALTEEVAYQHWHRMLFARFLVENNLLMDDDPVSPISLTIEECNDLAPSLGARNGWDLAARYASRMLPQIFLNDSPIFSLEFPIERQKVLEQLVSNIPQEVFHASDSLGWVYQFWQTKRKKDINDSGVKIGARELPAVTQLFTEPYMVSFLLDNSLGAWWAAKRLSIHDFATADDEQELRDKAYIDHLPLEYLRFVRDEETEFWKPAGGSFDAWPKHLSEFKMLDPCCGSGHFLGATLQMLVPMRMELEGLTADEAIQKVLEENIHGLELDQRCVELAAFALAFAAWTYPGSSGYRQLPALHIACSGQAIHISDEELIKLSNGNHELYNALDDLKNKFQQAPILGSLIDPKSSIHQNELFSLDWEEVGPFLDSVLRKGQDDVLDEAGIVAQGLAKAASLLAGTYHLVATNVPYLARGKQDQVLKDYCDRYHNEAKNDLATVFLDRCLQFCPKGGTTTIVLPQNWLFLTSYKGFREKMLKEEAWNFIGRMGEHGFDSPAAAGAFTALIILQRGRTEIGINQFSGIDVSEPNTAEEKAMGLVEGEIKRVGQEEQLKNPDARVAFDESDKFVLLNEYGNSWQGIASSDFPRFGAFFWELNNIDNGWVFNQSTVSENTFFGGRSGILFWEDGYGVMTQVCQNFATFRGMSAWNKPGLVCSQMRKLPVTIYGGTKFDNNSSIITIEKEEILPALWCFCSSPEYNEAVRRIDQKLNVTNATLVKVPFDLERWTKVAEEKYPNGLPLPFSDDPTQWIFHGHPCKSVIWDEDAKWTGFGPIRFDSAVLHVAVARLLGYRWPTELDQKMELAKEQRALVQECETLLPFADNDGIVCIPSVGGEFSAADRLLKMLKASFGDAWTDDTLSTLLRNTDASGKTLENWLRDKFFIQHCKLFGDRPFIWHVWDGLPDGFS
ncbi:MAG: SAM-dependent DNA methyltransferase, partial [Clostridia bacterium]|nr:SAM-dependent DNA methyltransferase [Clostridia bacterium]